MKHERAENRKALWYGLLPVAFLGLVLIQADAAGFHYDEGLYLLAAKGLATGHGLFLPNLLETYITEKPALVKYPPLFPLLLTPVWWLSGGFPENVIWLKVLNLLVAMIFLTLFFKVSIRHRQIPTTTAGLLMFFTGLHPEFLETGTTLLSEPLYLLLLMLLFTGEARYRQIPDGRHLILLVVLSAALFYTRTIGLVAVPALTLLLWRQRRGHALAYLSACLALMLPWFFWIATHSPPPVLIDGFEVRPFNLAYTSDLLANMPDSDIGNQVFRLLPAMLLLIAPFFKPLAGLPTGEMAVFLGSGILLGQLVLQALKQRTAAPADLFPGLYTGLYLLALALWPYPDQYPRLLLGILPCLLWLLHGWHRQRPERVQRVVSGGFLLALALNLILALNWGWQSWQGNITLGGRRSIYWQDYRLTVRQLKRLPKKARLWSNHAPLAHALYSSRTFTDKVMLLWKGPLPRTRPELSQVIQRQAAVQYGLLRQWQTDFIVVDAASQDELTRVVLKSYSRDFEKMYASPHGYFAIYALNPVYKSDIPGKTN